jgi:hypothetical protein
LHAFTALNVCMPATIIPHAPRESNPRKTGRYHIRPVFSFGEGLSYFFLLAKVMAAAAAAMSATAPWSAALDAPVEGLGAPVVAGVAGAVAGVAVAGAAVAGVAVAAAKAAVMSVAAITSAAAAERIALSVFMISHLSLNIDMLNISKHLADYDWKSLD